MLFSLHAPLSALFFFLPLTHTTNATVRKHRLADERMNRFEERVRETMAVVRDFRYPSDSKA